MTGREGRWSLAVENEADARKLIRESAMAFYVVAAIQAFAAVFVGTSMLWDAALFAGLALWLQRRLSRAAAVLLVLDSGYGIVATAINRLGGGQGGTNIVLALIVFWAAVRAVVATFKLSKFRSSEPQTATAT